VRPATTVPASLLPAAIGALGTGVVAVALHQPIIVLFGLSAILAAAATWIAIGVPVRLAGS